MPITTQVGSGLPHYSNSRASMNNWEPLFLNQFEVIITPPQSVSAGVGFLVEHVKKISGLPEITPTSSVEQFFKFAKRTYSSAKPEDTTAELEIEFEVNLGAANDMYIYNTLRQWADIHFAPDTGAQGLKSQYVGTMSVLIHNKARQVYREFTFNPVYMIDPLKQMDLDYQSDEIYILTAKFKADAWKENRNIGTETGAQ
jgi:hypothetical protein